MEARPMVNLELSWQQAGISAACLMTAAVVAARSPRPRLVYAAGFAGEAGLVLGLFALWQMAGSFLVMGPDGAEDRAQWIWHAERVVHMPSETVLQRVFLPHPLIVQAFNLYYAGLHFAVVIACLIWVFVRHRRQYPRVRTTLVLFTVGALLIQFIPVAPPRMLPADGMVDTAVRYGQSVYGSVAGFNADQLSAMPSVHIGWALLVALVLVEVSRSRWRWLALGLPRADDAGGRRHGEPLLARRARRGAAARAGARRSACGPGSGASRPDQGRRAPGRSRLEAGDGLARSRHRQALAGP
jgi:hypothetical protein